MDNLQISCIVPVYNTAEYLNKCIESILEQSYKNIELILIDDGSSDNSGIICDDWVDKDIRVKVIHQKNSGVSVARNVGVSEATGEYICFVDSDDYIEVDYFELAVNYLKEYNPVLMINNHTKDNKKKQKEHFVLKLNNKEAIEEMFLKKHFSWEPVGCFYKTAVCKSVNFDKNICYGEDLLFKYSFIKKAENNIVYVPLEKYHYVFRRDSACNSYNILKKVDDLKVLQFIIESEDNELAEQVYRNEYVPRLIKYYKYSLLSQVREEKSLAVSFKSTLKKDFSRIFFDNKIRFNLKIKIIFLKVLELIYA